MWRRWKRASLKMAMRGSVCGELFRWQPLILDSGNKEQSLMNSQTKVIMIREQRREKHKQKKRDSKKIEKERIGKQTGWGYTTEG